MENITHGEPNPTSSTLDEKDKDLTMVQASLSLYSDAIDKFCKCEGLCICKGGE